MHIKFGVDTFIWTENFCEDDLWVIAKAQELGFEAIDFAIAHPETFPTDKVVEELAKTDLTPVTTTTLDAERNLASPDAAVRAAGVESLKRLVDNNARLGSKILGGVNYAGWGCLTGKPRTQEEWDRCVSCIREVCEYALEACPGMDVCLECVHRNETHILNIAEDAVRFCKEVGLSNCKVHLDCYHMIREEKSFSGAVKTCGKEYLGYVHVNENDRGIPGTGLVPFDEFFRALGEIGYEGPCTIESFDPSFEELSGNCAIWRSFAPTGEVLAIEGLKNLKAIAEAI